MYKEGNADFHQMVADLAEITRKEAKTVNLGIMYGMGRKKLAGVMDIEEEEAKTLLEKYHERVPFVKGIADLAADTASTNGAIRTWLGRKCRFDMWEPKSFGYNKAMKLEEADQGVRWQGHDTSCFYIQGAEQTNPRFKCRPDKAGMVDCYKEGLLPMLTVHDELCFSIESKEQADRIVDIMENCIPKLNVPFEVDMALVNNWGEVE